MNETVLTWRLAPVCVLCCDSGASDEHSNASARLQEIYATLESIEADKAPARAAVILSGLGFNPSMQRRTTKFVLIILLSSGVVLINALLKYLNFSYQFFSWYYSNYFT